jgi:hypothetical protein
MTAPEIDPTRAVSERLNRRAFVGISAAAGLFDDGRPAT